MIDWIIAHIFRHKCPAELTIGSMGKAGAMQKLAGDDRFQLFFVDPKEDPKGGMELGHPTTPGKSSAFHYGPFMIDTRTEDAIELKRVREDIETFADQLDRWATDNHKAVRGSFAKDLAKEQRAYAYQLRQLLRADAAYEAMLDEGEVHSEME